MLENLFWMWNNNVSADLLEWDRTVAQSMVFYLFCNTKLIEQKRQTTSTASIIISVGIFSISLLFRLSHSMFKSVRHPCLTCLIQRSMNMNSIDSNNYHNRLSTFYFIFHSRSLSFSIATVPFPLGLVLFFSF